MASGHRRDFPFYAGHPVPVSGRGWLLVLAFCALGFAALITQPSPWPGPTGRWIGVILFVALPLIGLRIAAGRGWTALFPPPRWKDVWIGLAFVPVTIAASALVALFILHRGPISGNPVIGMLSDFAPADLAIFLASTLPQLLGEEIITILPFLATLTVLYRRAKLPRGVAILGAWIVSAALFVALHLPTYGWHVLQTFAVIGTARLVLTLPFLITKSLWSSTVTHVTNDWVLFGFVGGMAALKAGGGL